MKRLVRPAAPSQTCVNHPVHATPVVLAQTHPTFDTKFELHKHQTGPKMSRLDALIAARFALTHSRVKKNIYRIGKGWMAFGDTHIFRKPVEKRR